VTPDHEAAHERIDELLAAYALGSVDGADAEEADRLLADHVPSCSTCHQTFADLREVAGDLALEARPAEPGDLVWQRIRHGMDDVPLAGRSPRRAALVALAASLVGFLAMGGLSVTMATRASRAEDARATALRLVSLMRSPGVDPNSVEPVSGAASSFTEVSSPDVRRMYVVADVCPQPAAAHAYQVWLGDDGSFAPIGEPFVPQDGHVLLELTVDVARYDEIWITEEPLGVVPTTPTLTGRSWRAALT
jgi:hypothetical protein